jgi:hypothetical protein
MNEELQIVGSYARAVFREWWVIVIEILLVMTDVVERVLGTWLLPSSRTKVVLGLVVLVIAQYRAYRKLFLKAQGSAREPTELEIHEERGSKVYIETPSGAALPTSNYFELHFVVQNKGPQTSVVRKFDLEIEGIPGKHENLGPTRRNSIQTRDAQMMLQFASTLEGSSLVVAAHNVWSGILGLQLGALPINSREVRCTLRITDGNASSAHHTFTLPVVG